MKLRHRFLLGGPDLSPREVETLSGLVQRVHLRTKEPEAELENRSLLWTKGGQYPLDLVARGHAVCHESKSSTSQHRRQLQPWLRQPGSRGTSPVYQSTVR